MAWPMSQDYNEAIQTPTANFTDPDLRAGQVVTDALGLPIPCSGNFADVYEVRCPNGSRWAVKCFTREVPGQRERYSEISRHLGKAQLSFVVDFSYLEQGILVGGRWYPVLKMQWVEGLTLNQFVAQCVDKPAMLESLLQLWAKMANYLRAAEVGHCDLQHGNILLVAGAKADLLKLRLIDYDGMWVPALAGTLSGEVGHPSYQHPQRQRESTYNLEVDRFSVLLIATALRALKVHGKALWDKYDNGDNLLFCQQDLESPSKSRLFYELLKLSGASDRVWVENVIEALRQPLDQTPLLKIPTPEVSAPPARPKPPEAAPWSATSANVVVAATAQPARVVSAPPRPASVPRKVVQAATVPKPAEPAKEFRSLPTASSVAARGVVETKVGRQRGISLWVFAAVPAVLLMILGGGVTAMYLTNRGASSKVAQGPPPSIQNQAPAPNTPPAPMPNQPSPVPSSPPAPNPPPPPIPNPPPPPVPNPPPMPKPMPAVEQERRLPVPSTEAKENAEKLIKDKYGTEYAKKGTESLKSLADKLRKEATNSPNDAALRFVLLREASDVAARGGDPEEALASIDQIANEYAVNAVVEMKLAALNTAANVSMPTPANKFFVEAARDLSDRAIADDNYRAATSLIIIARDIARKYSQSAVLLTEIVRQCKQVEQLEKDYAAIKADREALAVRPDDPAANLAVGRFYCLRKGDWMTGLHLLCKGSDANLQALAELELYNPTGAAIQLKLADAWHALADAEPSTDKKAADAEQSKDKTQFLRRAYYWYQQALPGLKDQERLRADKQIGSIVAKLPDLNKPEQLHVFEGHTEDVLCVVFSPDGRRVLSGSKDQSVRVWQVDTGKELPSLRPKFGVITNIAFSGDGRQIICAGFPLELEKRKSYSIKSWDAETGKDDPGITPAGKENPILLALGPEGKQIVAEPISVPGGGKLCMLNVVEFKGAGARQLSKEKAGATCIAVSSDGTKVLTGGGPDDVTLHLWDLQTEKVSLVGGITKKGIVSVTFSADAKRALTGGADNVVRVWDLANGKEVVHMLGHDGKVNSVSFSSDGLRVLSGSADKTVRVWDAKTGKELWTFKEHKGAVLSVTFSPDGHTALSGSADKTVRLWRVPR